MVGLPVGGFGLSRWGLIDNSLEGRQAVYFPHFFNKRVPTDPLANRAWRHRWFLTTNESERKAIRKMAAEDFLWWLTGFASIFDAGDETGKPGPIPFIPYEFQIELFTALWDSMHVSRRPVRVKKPRRLGLSYMVIALFQHCWQFQANRHLLVGSHREDVVDGATSMSRGSKFAGEWSKLLPKFDFMQVWQPPWLLPRGFVPREEPNRVSMRIMNPENGSIVWGTSAASRSGHGERGYAMLWDEASRTDNLYEIIGGMQAFTPCKFWVSTIGNLDHPFSTLLKDAPGIVQLNPQWWMNPEYTEGLKIDAETGKHWSPWLQRKLDEINSDPVKANELYFADETQQIGGYYNPDTFRAMLGTSDKPGTVMAPLHRGEPDIIETRSGEAIRLNIARFVDQANGRMMMWINSGPDGRPPRGTRYVLGVDVAAGTQDSAGRGASNSVIAGADWLTGDLAFEFVCHGVTPTELARITVALGYWFEGDDHLPAYVVFERNGPGGEFGSALVKTFRYPNVYIEDRDHSPETKFGWHKDGRGDDARLAFGLHRVMICDGRFKERSMDCVNEMRHYQHNSNGRGAPVHSASLVSEDPSGSRENHGDRVIARVCLCQALQRPYATLPKKGMAPWGSYKHGRLLQEEAEEVARSNDWDGWREDTLLTTGADW